jgi:starch synthase
VPSNENDIIFHVAAELAPRAKVGGLGDVVAGLARECTSRGRRAVVVLPFYECLPEDAVEGLELADEFPCPKGKPGDGRRGGNVEQLGVSAFSGRLDGIEVLLLRPDWSKTNLFRGGRIYGGSYNEAEA